MMITVRPGEPLAGGTMYVAAEETFLFVPVYSRGEPYVHANAKLVAVSIGTLNLNIDSSSYRILYVSGRHSKRFWALASLEEPSRSPGVVTVDSSILPEKGTVRAPFADVWSTKYDPSNGWIRIAADDMRDELAVEVAGGTVIGGRGGRLHSIWLNPYVAEGPTGISEVSSDPRSVSSVVPPRLSERWASVMNIAPMPWSLGIVGDLVWNIFPQLRPQVRDLLVHSIDISIDSGRLPPVNPGDEFYSDDQLSSPEADKYVTFILRPVLDSVANGAASVDTLCQVCTLLRFLLTYDGEYSAVTGIQAEDVIESIATPTGIAAIAAYDPELVAHVRSELGMWSSNDA